VGIFATAAIFATINCAIYVNMRIQALLCTTASGPIWS